MLTDPLAFDSPTDKILDRAADLITEVDRHIDGYWPNQHTGRYQPGTPVDAIGAIAVVLGFTTTVQVVTNVFSGAYLDGGRFWDCHDAVQMLAYHQGLVTFDDLFAWSDGHTAQQIAEAMRTCAAALRVITAEFLLVEDVPA